MYKQERLHSQYTLARNLSRVFQLAASCPIQTAMPSALVLRASVGFSYNEIGNSGAEALTENLHTMKKIPCTRTASSFLLSVKVPPGSNTAYFQPGAVCIMSPVRKKLPSPYHIFRVLTKSISLQRCTFLAGFAGLVFRILYRIKKKSGSLQFVNLMP